MKNQSKTVTLVIPVYNEAWCVVPLYKKISQLAEQDHRSYHTIFVDGDSADETTDQIKKIMQSDDKVELIRLSRDYGITQALMAGFDHASGDYIVTLDGNLQNDPADIPKMLDELDAGADVCSGWREVSQGSLYQELPNKILNAIISRISDVKLHDYECSLKAYRRESLKGIYLYGELHQYIPVFAYWKGARISEVRIKQYPRAHGHGKKESVIKRTIKTSLDLLLLKFFSKYAQHPLHVFGTMGIMSLGLSLLAFLAMLYFKFFGDKSFIETPLPSIVLFTAVLGILFIFLGVLAEFIIRIYYESSGQSLYKIAEHHKKDK